MSIFFSLAFFFFALSSSVMSNGKIRSHDECRKILCAACGKKDQACSKVTPTIEEQIQIEVSKVYRENDSYFPCGICSQCRKWLFAAKKGKVVPESVRERWNSMDFEGFKAPSRSTPCSCNICKRVRYKEANLEMSAQVDLPRKPNEVEKPEEAEARIKYFDYQKNIKRGQHFFSENVLFISFFNPYIVSNLGFT